MYNRLSGADVRRILILHQRRLGDIVLATPVIRLLAERYAPAHITFVCEPAFTALLDGVPEIARVWPLPDQDVSAPLRWWRLRVLGRKLRAENFDLVVDLRCSRLTARLTAASAAPVRIGRQFKSHGFAYNYFVEPARLPDDEHLRDYLLRSARTAGCTTEGADITPRLFVSDESIKTALALPGVAEPYAVLHPGSSRDYKCWPTDRFARLADYLAAVHGLRVVLTAGPGEQDRAQAVIYRTTNKPVLLHLLPLPVLAAVLKRACIVIGNDSGPMHMAGAVGTPVVSLYAEATPVQWGVLGAPARLLRAPLTDQPTADRKSLIKAITFKDVTTAADQLLAEHLEHRITVFSAAVPGSRTK